MIIFTAYIDPYYYLTFIDVNKLFSQDGEIDTSIGYMLNSGDTFRSGEGQAEGTTKLSYK